MSVLAADGNAYDAGVHGGVGGGAFRSSCGANDVLVGVHLRHGTALDSITSICSPLNPERTDWVGGKYQPTGLMGGDGGGPLEVVCRNGDVMHSLTVEAGPWGDLTVVKTVHIGCHDLDSANSYWLSIPAASTISSRRTFSCKAGDWATGLFGNSGTLVDRIGLSCDHIAPLSFTTPPSSETPPAAPQRPIKPMRPLTKEECDAEGSLWIAQKERCIGKALLTALRTVCEKKGADYRFDPQTAQCIGPQQGGGQNFCTVKKTGTVYDRPGGDEIGELDAPTEGVTLLKKEGTNWYHVKWPAGEGWVYSGPGYEDAIACP
jgi:hypothetical protein